MAPRYGGPVVAARGYCRGLAAQGVEVDLFTTSVDYPSVRDLPGPTGEPIVADRYTTWRFPVVFRPYLVAPALWRKLAKTIRSYDIVHIHGLYRFHAMAASWHARRSGVPYIQRLYGSLDPELHGKAERRRAKHLYERLVEFPSLNRAAAIHYTSEDERRLVEESLSFDARSIIVPVPVEGGRADEPLARGVFRSKHGLTDRKIVLHFGRLTRKKGLDILIEACAEAAREQPDIALVLAGPDNEGFERVVRGWVEKAGIAYRTLFAGMIEPEQKWNLLCDADVFALTSYSENFGIAVVEAMAANLPVVISDRVNIATEVEAAGAGVVVPCEAGATARALAGLLRAPRKVRDLARAGAAFANKFKVEQIGRTLLDRYTELLAQPTTLGQRTG